MAAVAKEVAQPAATTPTAPPARYSAPAASPRRACPSRGSARRRRTGRAGATAAQPNILVIMVDQLRTPQWFTASPALARMLPNISRLRREGVSFERHYTASNDCTPARSTLLTGLYTHQTGCMITGGARSTRASRPGGRCCANRATRPGGMASGTSRTETTSGRCCRMRGRLSRMASPAAPTPHPTAAPARAGAWTR